MKRVVILGSTGSIGRMALEVISRHSDDFCVVGLAAGKNVDLLGRQVKAFRPQIVAVAKEEGARELRRTVGRKTEVCFGEEGMKAVAACRQADFVLSAMVGFSGLVPTVHAVRAGKVIGLANKESLVIAGSIVMKEAKAHRATILPVDSEHSAVFQCLEGQDRRYVKRIILTASGGPFMGRKKAELREVSPEEALQHPNWSMGKKITIDSATMMNKGLEVIEASHLFCLPHEMIDVVVHPQSIVHSMVEFRDGALLAQISVPDMRGPIAYALSYPRRLASTVARLELASIQQLTFHKPDTKNFPCLQLAYDALREGGTMPAVLNAVNEVAVNAFLEKRINFGRIPVIIKRVMNSHTRGKAVELGAVIEVDKWAREKAEEHIRRART
ncbi:MAG TPA: 1-deoxy-D-xylulose-5-phosphate reductoisomerase [Thermodesulfovibrionales bacterium]|nr:1-deoxy-D-xylulose-5-phosphate reductoisomerase [Thermodesulfovibrionales bacterium]